MFCGDVPLFVVSAVFFIIIHDYTNISLCHRKHIGTASVPVEVGLIRLEGRAAGDCLRLLELRVLEDAPERWLSLFT